MTTKRIVGTALLAAVLLMTGCKYVMGDATEANGPETHVRSAILALQTNQPPNNVKKDLQQAIDQLPNEGEANEIKEKLNEAKNRLPDNPDESTKRQVIRELEPLAQRLQSVSRSDAISDHTWQRWLMLAIYILSGIVAALLVVTGLTHIWNRAWRNVEINVARMVAGHLSAERKAQPDFTDKFAALAQTHKEINNNVLDVQTEVRTLARMVRDSLADRNDRRPAPLPLGYQPQSDGSTLKDEPEFPVSVNEYLGRMSRYANAVKLDFQNGILVNDPDKKDELFLIRDSRQPDEPLFLVPGAAQFHNKQDFEIYYAKYYECVKPAMGEVWILGPAVVAKVPGGWQLREKGMLEVR